MEAIPIKIRIFGACGSGKSSIAKIISEKYKIRFYEMDNLVWDRSMEDRKNPPEVRDMLLDELLKQDSWIVEGVHYKWGHDSYKKADLIFIIRLNTYIRDIRVVKRFIRTRLRFEKSNYKQTLKDLFAMIFKWNREYDKNGIVDILSQTEEYSAKRIMVKDSKEILKYIEEYVSSRAREESYDLTHARR